MEERGARPREEDEDGASAEGGEDGGAKRQRVEGAEEQYQEDEAYDESGYDESAEAAEAGMAEGEENW
jgi:hypothetical protein